MRAYRLLLTHFSQRYHKLPELEEDHPARPRVIVAFDLMRFNLRGLPWLPFLVPPLQALFAATPGAEQEDQKEMEGGEGGSELGVWFGEPQEEEG